MKGVPLSWAPKAPTKNQYKEIYEYEFNTLKGKKLSSDDKFVHQKKAIAVEIESDSSNTIDSDCKVPYRAM